MKNKKVRLRSKADKLWFEAVMKQWNYKSVVSGQPAQQVHHFFPKGQYGHLRYDLDNGIPLTTVEHFNHHHRGDPLIHQQIIEKRGKKWYNKLRKKALNHPTSSYITIGWYRENIERLEDFIKRLK